MIKIETNYFTKYDFKFDQLYTDNFQKILTYVQKNSGVKADAEDLFQDALIVLIKKLSDEKFVLSVSINTYLYAICKNLWLKKLRGKHTTYSIEEIQSTDFLIEFNDSQEDSLFSINKLNTYLNKITSHCNKLLNDIYFRAKSIFEIQLNYGYSSKRNAQNQKYKCLEQLRRVKMIEEKK